MTAARLARAIAIAAVALALLNGVLLVTVYGPPMRPQLERGVYLSSWVAGALGVLTALASVVATLVDAARAGLRVGSVLTGLAGLAAGLLSGAIGLWMLIVWGFGHSH